MHSATLPIQTIPTKTINKLQNPRIPLIHTPNSWKPHNNSTNNSLIICRASSSSSSSSITDFDLYDLLGVDSSSNHAQIKLAYRALQKRCHPDIAGPSGHDMAIILNEAYALLSDPVGRMAYDKEMKKIADLKGYTGKPLYSAWCGAENEERAVFVDEVKCVGCLKCALFADKTFAIESAHGRARVVAQWADTETSIQQAIDACPVDCISYVERSNLAALEFLMSKKPRGNVRVGAGNTVGARTSNIFDDLDKFQRRYQDAMNNKASTTNSTASDAQTEPRMSAFQAIRAMSNWLYWQSPSAGTAQADRSLVLVGRRRSAPDVKKLKEAAAARKQAKAPVVNDRHNDEYWSPLSPALLEETNTGSPNEVSSETSPQTVPVEFYAEVFPAREKYRQGNPWLQGVPISTATVAAVIVWQKLGEEASGGLDDHIGGPLALGIVNSSWSQVILASVTWYIIGMALGELVGAIQSLFRKDTK